MIKGKQHNTNQILNFMPHARIFTSFSKINLVSFHNQNTKARSRRRSGVKRKSDSGACAVGVNVLSDQNT